MADVAGREATGQRALILGIGGSLVAYALFYVALRSADVIRIADHGWTPGNHRGRSYLYVGSGDNQATRVVGVVFWPMRHLERMLIAPTVFE